MSVHVKVGGAWVEIGASVSAGSAYVPYTSSASVVVPDGVTEIDIVAVGGGGFGVDDSNGGRGGEVIQVTRSVTPGETLAVTVGAGGVKPTAGTDSTVVGSFGTVRARYAQGAATSVDGTYVPVWGWLGGGGASRDVVVGQAQVSNRVGYGGGGVSDAAWGSISTPAQAGAPNSGGGGGAAGAPGGSGFIGIVYKNPSIMPANGWAKVSGGTVTTINNADGSVDEVHTFLADGSLTVESPGYARVLLVGGGSAYHNLSGQEHFGGGGDIVRGIHSLPAGSLPVAIGAGGVVTNEVLTNRGGASSLGTVLITSIGPGDVGAAGVATVLTADGIGRGVWDDITGASLEYGGAHRNPCRPNFGEAGNGLVNGSSGIVIVRVQKTAPTVSGVVATGGTVTEYTGDGTNGVAGQKYRVHTFTANGDLVVAQGGTVRALVVGGGGPGSSGLAGMYEGAGGGAGGFVEATLTLTAGTVPVAVGAGGLVGTRNGGTSSLGALAAVGGGGPLNPGGSGGGGIYNNGTPGGVFAASQGFPGGAGNGSGLPGSGGGASAAGTLSGPGGAGKVSTITGVAVTYATGGGVGGTNQANTPGAANSGDGGAGGWSNTNHVGSVGGSGVVVVRYEIAG